MKNLLLISLGMVAIQVGALVPQTGPNSPPAEAADMVRIDDFYIDIYEYPNQKGALPRVEVTWTEARDLCRAQGKRLCTESEWEKACRGAGNTLYGYGPTFVPGRCNTPYQEEEIWKRGPGLAPSGSFAQCASEYGVYDMIGNVWEWTEGWYSRQENWRVVRGGSWFHSVNLARANVRYGHFLTSDYRLDMIGFRCCRSASEATPAE